MIRNIIFDFGDVFLNLDKSATHKAFQKLGLSDIPLPMVDTLKDYEIGKLTTPLFIEAIREYLPKASAENIVTAWNAILLDFPEDRLEFLERLKNTGNHRIFLLSNTNDLHINHVKNQMGKSNYIRFRSCFEQFYLSHEIGQRKPNPSIYQWVLNQNQLNPQETLFIDDTLENCQGAKVMGINTWHLQIGQESVLDLHKKIKWFI